MYCTITPNKTGGCSGLINYLEKEDSQTRDFANYLDKENQLTDKPDLFFNGERRDVDKFEVIEQIDKSGSRGFMKNESRFFSLTFNPSEKEIAHIRYLAYNEALKLEASGTPGSFDDMKEEIRKELFKQYAVECMDNYAKNFGRDGISDNKDLVWYGKIERDRYWKYNCDEVKYNKKLFTQISRLEKKSPVPTRQTADKIQELHSKLIRECDVRKGGADKVITEMMPKSGDNYHIHVVVSRRAKDLNMKLSPLAKARSDNEHKVSVTKKNEKSEIEVIGQKTCKIGFDRNKFVMSNEQSFDKTFNYQRSWIETIEARKLQKENPELYKETAKEKYKEENGYTRRELEASRDGKHMGISGRTVDKVTQEAGLKYIREAKPYYKVVKTAVKGYSVLAYNTRANTMIRDQALKNYAGLNRDIGNLAKDVIMRGTGLSKSLSVVNPYIAAANLIRSGIQLAQGNKGQEY
jgi:DNA-directed RNA polymerase subunit K/omega